MYAQSILVDISRIGSTYTVDQQKPQSTWKALLIGEASWLMAVAAAMAWDESAGASMATSGRTPSDSQSRSPTFCWGVPFARSCSAHAAPVSAQFYPASS